MGHYFKGKTHFEYTHKHLSAYTNKVQTIMKNHDGDTLSALKDIYRDLRNPSDDVALSGGIHALFRVLIESTLGDDCLSYTNHVNNGRITDAIDPVIDFMGHTATLNETMMSYHMYAHTKTRGPTYEMTGSLVKQLLDTELKGVLADEIRLPFPSIYVDIPPTDDFVIYNPHSGKHSVCGVYIAEDHAQDVRALRTYIIGAPHREVSGLPDDATLYYNLKLVPGMLAEETYERAEKLAKETNAIQHVVGNAWHDIHLWVLNTILYLTWGEPGEEWMANKEARDLWARIRKLPKGSKKRKKLNDRLHKLDPQKRIVIGRGIKYERPKDYKPGQKIGTTFRVAGHWKRQRYGKGRQEIKRIFIEPYWKGIGDTALNPRTYSVR